MNPLNLGNTLDEEVMNFFNEEKYIAWQEKTYHVSKQMADKFEAVTDKPEIVIIGDYDVDGAMSTKEMVTLLHILHPNSKISYIVPKRFTDGYGISSNITDALISQFKPEDTCVVTVDNGISQFTALNRLFESGFSIAMTDHHMPQTVEDGSLRLPFADILVNPHIRDEKHKNDFEFEHYCGAGVVYQLAKQLIDDEEVLNREFLPYAAIATIADVVPLIEDNWCLVHKFLENIGEFLPEELNFTYKPATYIDEEDIGFSICPVLNAAGRLLDNGAEKVVSYLFNPTEEEKTHLLELNQQRKDLTAEQTNLVLEYIAEHNIGEMEPICVNIPGLHHGIVGIIAGRVTETFGRACMICSDGKGSGRAPEDFNIFNYGTEHMELFDKFGGHPGACGFSISDENFAKLAEFSKYKEVIRKKHFDIRLDKTQISEFYQSTKKFRPFGESNPAPKCMVQIRPTDKIGWMGKENPVHLYVRNNDGSKVVHFYHLDPDTGRSGLADERSFDGVGKVNLNFFRGEVTPQLNIEEVYDPEEEGPAMNSAVPNMGR